MDDSSKYVKTEVSEVKVDERGFVRLSFPQNVEINYDQAYAIYRSRVGLSLPRPQLLLVDLTSDPRPTREARQFAKSDEIVGSTKAMACLVDGLLGKMVGNLLLTVTQGRVPMKIFHVEDDAVNWLLTYEDEKA